MAFPFTAPKSPSTPLPAPAFDPQNESATTETAVFAGGCFWGVETVFQRVKGVLDTTVGYSGGEAHTATYKQVCNEDTNHAEAVKIDFDPRVITYGTLLRLFFSVIHDPTQLNRQGNDVGTSYRSAIFYTSPEQKEIAERYMQQLTEAHAFSKPIVTQLNPLTAFYDGEDYHQDFATKNPSHPYIQVCDIPKLNKFRQQFPEMFQEFHLQGR